MDDVILRVNFIFDVEITFPAAIHYYYLVGQTGTINIDVAGFTTDPPLKSGDIWQIDVFN